MLCAVLGATALYAGDWIDISPITDKILMIDIKDGHICYGAGAGVANNAIYNRTTDTNAVVAFSSYTLSSTDDINYATARQPISIGRKSKTIEWNTVYAAGNVPKYVWGHWIYMEWPTALVQGRHYLLTLTNGLVDNNTARSFVYDVNTLRSETVHVNQIGFPTNGPKRAYLSQWMGSFNTPTNSEGGLNLSNKVGNAFRLINQATGQAVYTNIVPSGVRWCKTDAETYNTDFQPRMNFTHADVWELNFDGFSKTGEYVVAVDGIGCSFPFQISNESTRDPFYYAMKGLFWQRVGIVKQVAGSKFMPRDHHPNDIVWRYDSNCVTVSSLGISGFNTKAPQVFSGTNPPFTGGHYHDAGDWDQDGGSHWMIPMTLMLLYDLAPTNFYDGEVGNKYKFSVTDTNWIDEGTNGIPDILDEAAWLINFHKYARTNLLAVGATGGVPGYVGRDACSGPASWLDTRDWWVTGENPTSTYYYAASAAWFAACLGTNNASYATWTNEAIASWNWANGKNQNQTEPRGVAAACLYRLTGATNYQTIFKTIYTNNSSLTTAWQGNNFFSLGMSVYALLPAAHPNLDTAFQTTVKSQITSDANQMEPRGIGANRAAGSSGMRLAHTHPYVPFVCGIFNTPTHLFYAVAHKFTSDTNYLNCIQHMCNYTLGGNPLNMCFMTGLGKRSDCNVFHPDSWAVNAVTNRVYQYETLPGFTSYFGSLSDFSTGYFDGAEWVTRNEGSYPVLATKPGGGTPAGVTNIWPESESRFFNRNSIFGSEFTVSQQQRFNIFNYGYLKAVNKTSSSPYVPNARPTISLNLTNGQVLSLTGFTLTANASAGTRAVQYYRDWHFIGESRDKTNNFALPHVPWSACTNELFTAVAYDDTGLISLPSDVGNKTVSIIQPLQRTLLVFSAYGGTNPGTVVVNDGSTLSLWVTNSPLSSGVGTQFVCTGAAVVGNQFTPISATNIALTLTNAATLTWNWQTQCWLTAAASGSGTVIPSNGWFASGSNLFVTAQPSKYYAATGWSGQTNSCAMTCTQISFIMTAPRALQAQFAPILATNNVPQWWLAQYGLTNGGFDANALLDSDGDGVPNWAEYVAGTNPTNKASVLRIANFHNGSVFFTPAFTDRSYAVLSATNLLSTNWTRVTTYQYGTGAVMTLPATNLAPQLFYRITVQFP